MSYETPASQQICSITPQQVEEVLSKLEEETSWNPEAIQSAFASIRGMFQRNPGISSFLVRPEGEIPSLLHCIKIPDPYHGQQFIVFKGRVRGVFHCNLAISSEPEDRILYDAQLRYRLTDIDGGGYDDILLDEDGKRERSIQSIRRDLRMLITIQQILSQSQITGVPKEIHLAPSVSDWFAS